MRDTLEGELLGHVMVLASSRMRGRVPLTTGSEDAREHVKQAFVTAGLDPVELDIVTGGKKHGTSVVATLQGANPDDDHFILIGAHYDHIHGSPGADDNAAAVAEMLYVARQLAAGPPLPRTVVFVAFDCEEPPHFHSNSMGSTHFLDVNVPDKNQVDLAVILDLTGHAPAVTGLEDRLFVTGTEGSRRLHAVVSSPRDGVVPACIHNDHVGDMSDHHAFHEAGLPFVFLSAGYWRHYHSPTDTIEELDLAYMAGVARWLEGFTRDACAVARDGFKHDPFDEDEFAGLEARLLSQAIRRQVTPAQAPSVVAGLKQRMITR